jgi:hypothetical protein
MPRRMMRHKTLQQCARLAFGISAPDLKSPSASTAQPKMEMHSKIEGAHHSKKILREKLISKEIKHEGNKNPY